MTTRVRGGAGRIAAGLATGLALALAAGGASAQGWYPGYGSYGYGGLASGPYNGAYGYPQYGYAYQTGSNYGYGGYPYPDPYGNFRGGIGLHGGYVPSWWSQRDIGGYRGCDPYWQRGECFDNYYGAYVPNVLTGGWPGSGASYVGWGRGGGCCWGGGWRGGWGPEFQPGYGFWNGGW